MAGWNQLSFIADVLHLEIVKRHVFILLTGLEKVTLDRFEGRATNCLSRDCLSGNHTAMPIMGGLVLGGGGVDSFVKRVANIKFGLGRIQMRFLIAGGLPDLTNFRMVMRSVGIEVAHK